MILLAKQILPSNVEPDFSKIFLFLQLGHCRLQLSSMANRIVLILDLGICFLKCDSCVSWANIYEQFLSLQYLYEPSIILFCKCIDMGELMMSFKDCKFKLPMLCGNHAVHSQAKQEPFLSIRIVSNGLGQKVFSPKSLLVSMPYQLNSL